MESDYVPGCELSLGLLTS